MRTQIGLQAIESKTGSFVKQRQSSGLWRPVWLKREEP